MSWPSSTVGFAQSDFHHVGDLCISELATSISNSDSSGDTFEVDSVTRFSTWPSTSFVVRVGTEDIFVSSRSGTTLTIGQREHGGTPKSSHGAGAKVRVVNSSVNIGSIHSEVRGVQDTLLGNTSDDLDISNIIDIDSSNNQVGINKSPSRALDVQGDGEVSGEMKANEFVGDGRRLTGIGDTGGLINDGNTTIAADDNSDGSGSIILQTQQTTRMEILSSGKVEVKDVDFSIDSTVFEVDATNDRVFLHGPASDPGSGSLSAGQIVFWLDEVNDQIEVRALESDGTTNITETISIIDPAGNDGELQYNNGGSFGATAGFTYDDTGQEVHFASATGIVLEESTANFTINWNDPGAARTLTVPDPGSNDVFLFEGRTLTGGTGIESIGDLSTDRTINFDTAAGLTITGDHDYSGGGVILPTATAPSPTTEGDIVWDTDDDKILVGDGSASVTMVKESRTLTGGTGIGSIGDLSTDRTINFDTGADLTLTGSYDFTGGTVTVTSPSATGEAATKGYVDSTAQGLDWKDSVRAATDGSNIDLSSSSDPNPVDGVSLSDGDRILLKDQSTGSENGIYEAVTATDPTTWTRTDDANEDDEVSAGMTVWVEEGTSNGDQAYVLTTNDPITVGSTSLSFSAFSTTALTAGDGLTKSGNTLDVGSGAGITVNADDVAFDTAASLTITGNHDHSGGGVILPTATTPSPTTEGDIVWDTDDDKILVGDGSDTVTMVKESRTLTGGTGIESIGDLSTDRTINFDTAAGLTITGDHDYSGGGVILPTATAPSPTTEGDIVWDTDDDKILVGDGSASVTMVKESRTLTGGHAIQSIGDLSADRTVAVDATDLSGDGLTDSGAGTALQVNPDTGIDVAASGVSVDQSFSPSWTGTHDYSGGDVVVPTKTSDPSSPSTGQIWLRTDL